jgi:GH15 family glucan-1,4-alpha-glucosidase
MSKPLEDYGIIGNMLSAALVARDGSVDWLCLPRFDSPACFAALLGGPRNGRWLIAPDGENKASRRYLDRTAVIETRFETPTGSCTVTDFMPLGGDEQNVDLVRLVQGERGEVSMKMELVIRFNYGQTVPWVRRRHYGLSAVAGPDALELHTPVTLKGRDMTTTASFRVREGECVPFTLSYHPSHKAARFLPDCKVNLDRTVLKWQEWSSRCRSDFGKDDWREAVVRSAITLKLLTFAPTGGVVAAPTTSLPETLGGKRNWDYRYCWLRDSSRTLYALLNAGYREEAEDWRQWLLRTASGDPKQLQIMYGIAGERSIPERALPWLPGYEDSRPVRVGNAAVEQLQLDLYGELVETLHVAREADLASLDETWQLQRLLIGHLEKIWHQDDHGIWEVRGPPRAFTYSRLMCWVAFDRAYRSCRRFGLKGPVERWRKMRKAIAADILENGYDARRKTFVQYYGGKALDASVLLMPQTGFLPPSDRRVTGTIGAIESELLQNGLVMRYSTNDTDDGLSTREGAFLACSFWLADAYAMTGRQEDAAELFQRLLSIRSDLGLLAEEYDPFRKQLVGNFPQGFSHIGLINTAYNLVQAGGPAHQRSRGAAPKALGSAAAPKQTGGPGRRRR